MILVAEGALEMNRKVNLPLALIAFAALAALLYFAYDRAYNHPAYVNPGLADIPPHHPGDDKQVVPPKDAGPIPGAMKR